MKLLRFGTPGNEKPGLMAPDGSIRDLSGVVPDVAGDALLPATLWAGFTGPLELMAAGQLHDALPRRWRRAPGRLSRQRGTCPARNVPSAEHTVSSAVIPQQPAQSPRLPPSQSPYAGREALAMPAAYT